MKILDARARTDPDLIKRRVDELTEAFAAVHDALHKFDGTQADSPYGLPEMRVAGEHLRTAFLWARQAIEAN